MKLSEAARKAKREYMKAYKARMTPEQKEAQREYQRQWRRRNKDKISEYNNDYWERKAGVTLIRNAGVTSVTNVTTHCMQCNTPLSNSRQKFCSHACKQKNYRQNK